MHTITIERIAEIERAPITPALCLVTTRELLLVTQAIEIMPGVLFTIVDVYSRTLKSIEIEPRALALLSNPCSEIRALPFDFRYPVHYTHDDRADALSLAHQAKALFDQPEPEPAPLADEVADMESKLAAADAKIDQLLEENFDLLVKNQTQENQLAAADEELGDALLQIDDLKVQLSQSQAREQLLSDRLNAEAAKRRDSESKIEGLERELSHERLARGAVSDRLLAKDRDLLRLGDRYNELRTKLAALQVKLRVRHADGEPTILIRELLTDLSNTQGTPR